MRVHVAVIVSTVLLSFMLTASAAHSECGKIPIQDFLIEHKDAVILKGGVSAFAETNDPDGRLLFKYTFEVERVWQGSVGKRIDLYVSLSGNEPQLGPTPFLVVALRDSVRQRLGITRTDTPAYTTVWCSDVYTESEIRSALGPGKEPSKEAARSNEGPSGQRHR